MDERAFCGGAGDSQDRGEILLRGDVERSQTLIEQVPRRQNVPRNQTQLLVSDTPDGPYKPLVMEKDFCLGPENWDIIDGTLYQEDGTEYMVFVHEWTQLIDGTMAYMPLSADSDASDGGADDDLPGERGGVVEGDEQHWGGDVWAEDAGVGDGWAGDVPDEDGEIGDAVVELGGASVGTKGWRIRRREHQGALGAGEGGV